MFLSQLITFQTHCHAMSVLSSTLLMFQGYPGPDGTPGLRVWLHSFNKISQQFLYADICYIVSRYFWFV